MNTLIKMYYSLLADVRHTFRVPLGFPDDITPEWVLKEAPELDKKLLEYFETGGEIPPCPEWIKPLLDYTLAKPMWRLGLLRTLLNFGYKAEYAPTTEQIRDAEKAFLDVEDGIGIWDESHDPSSNPFFRRVRTVIWRVLSRIKSNDWQNAVPHHGPGAVYPRYDPAVRSSFCRQYKTIEEFYPFDSFFRGIFQDSLMEEPWDEPTRDIVCRMTAVPKDSRGPRLICVHPREAIWIQQSQRSVLEHAIRTSPLTSPFIHFDDQTINAELALASSISGEFFTLDLKEASDRLSRKLVDYLLGDHACLLSCARASHVQLLSGRTCLLRKWAPMGNCLTFPVESLIFWALAYTAICTDMGSNAYADVYVFGDDILAPTKTYEVVLNRLVQAGLVPNRRKTFKEGSFRESCGVDAFLGVDNTPLRTKVAVCSSYASAESLCQVAKAAWLRGYRELPSCIYGTIRKWLESHGRKLYYGNSLTTQGIYEYVDWDLSKILSAAADDPESNLLKVRFNSNLQRWESRYCRVVPQLVSPRHSWWNVLDSLISLERNKICSRDQARGLAYAIPNRNQPQLGWTPIER